MEPRWVAPDGINAGSRLLLLYQSLTLFILLVGLGVNCRLVVNWSRLLPQLNNVTYSFMWISVTDWVTLAIYIPTAVYYIITWQKPIGEAGCVIGDLPVQSAPSFDQRSQHVKSPGFSCTNGVLALGGLK
jgi:hypothetical protein